MEVGHKEAVLEERFVGYLCEAESGVAVRDLWHRHGFSNAWYYLWRGKWGGMSLSQAKRLKELETETARRKKLLAESMLEIEVMQDALRKWL